MAPCTQRGKVIGPTVKGIARRLVGAEAERIDAIGRQSWGGRLWRLIYRLRHWEPVQYEVSPVAKE
jgi:hypothetical protein